MVASVEHSGPPGCSALSGHLRLRAAARDNGTTILAQQSFRTPFHLSKPYWDADSRTLVVQVVNPTAGILAGDTLDAEIVADRDSALLVTTPSASRVFTMHGTRAESRQRFKVSAGAWLEVCPEPLVPHRGSRYLQVTEIAVESGGSGFFVDQLLPGRIGFGEQWEWAELTLAQTVLVGGEMVLQERFSYRGTELWHLAQTMGAGATACFANAVLLASPASPDWIPAVAALHTKVTWVGVSALRRGGWSIRIVAPTPIVLRDTLEAVRRILSAAYPRLGCRARKS